MFKQKYQNLNKIEISSGALIFNYHYLESKAKTPIAPVLKSNAYGHGIELVAKILEKEHPPFFCVDSLFEAYQLQKVGIQTHILIMGYIHPESLAIKKLPFSFAVYTPEMVEAIKKYQPQAPVHIFVDTGMHREGVMLSDLPSFVKKCQGLNIEGLMSHFGVANDRLQIESFKKAQEIISPKWIHLAASEAILEKSQNDICNLCRGGLALYGIDPKLTDQNLKPVLKLISTISQIKILNPGDRVGYDFTFVAKKKMKIAILPIGYNDGLDRRLSNFENIVGRVSMNITVVDISKNPNAKVGDKIVIYSDIQSVAKKAKLMPYELSIHLSPTTKRETVS